MLSRRQLLGGAAVAGVASVAGGALTPSPARAEVLSTPFTPVTTPHLAQAELMVQYQRMLAAGHLTDGIQGHWPLDGTFTDASGNGRDLTPKAGVTWSRLRAGGELSFDGTVEAWASTSTVLDTTTSFTVSAWVRLAPSASLGQMYTAVSQDGTTTSRFLLQYDPAGQSWVFKVRDENETAMRTAKATAPAQLDVWVHLAGVFDATAGVIRLYVDGDLAGSASTVGFPAWAAGGSFTIGRALFGANFVNRFNGAIDDVRAYGRALSAAEVALISGRTARQNNVYLVGASSVVTWGQPGDLTSWISHARCSSFLTWVLRHSYPWATADNFRLWFDDDAIPEAADFQQAFATDAGPHFQRVRRVADLRPGDLVAINYKGDPTNSNTGHIVMVRALRGTHSDWMDKPGETQHVVEVIDCTSDPHGSYGKGSYDRFPDTRMVDDVDNFEGVGVGHMIFYASDATGEFSRYRWSVNSTETNTHPVSTRPVSAARVR